MEYYSAINVHFTVAKWDFDFLINLPKIPQAVNSRTEHKESEQTQSFKI